MPSNIKVYGALWCPDCRRSKQFLNEHRVPYDWIDIDKDLEAQARVQQLNDGKQIIPTILFQDGSFLVEPTNAQLADKLDIRRQAQRQAYDVITIGGGPAGLTSAIYTAREGLRTLVIERSGLGGQAGVTQEIENYPGFPEPLAGAELADRLKQQAQRFDVELLQAQQVTRISQDGMQRVVHVETGEEYCAPAVIVATGSTYRRLNVPGEEDFIGAGVHFCATCDGPFYKGKDIVVVGGGNSGFQEGIFLTKFAKSVTILEVAKEPRASRALQEKASERADMEVLTETTIKEFRGNGRLSSILVEDLATGQTREMHPGAVFVFIGLLPNTEVLKDTLELDRSGFIVTRPNLETSIDGVFAAGDCGVGSTKQIASAVGEGATAALMVREYLERIGEALHTQPDPVPA